MKFTFLISIILIFYILPFISSQVVCSEDELVREILEDLADNGKLDCLIKSTAPEGENESESKKAKRLAAEWTSDCSFKSNPDNWLSDFINDYGLKKGLVDVDGKSVNELFSDQSDMCQIIRALVANGKFPEVGDDVTKIDSKIVDYINCPGDEGQTKVCAATGSSFADRDNWFILLKGKTITVNDEPKFEISKR